MRNRFLSIIIILNANGLSASDQNTYLPNADECRPATNTKFVHASPMTFNDELQCIVAGHRKIIFSDSIKNPNSFDENLKVHKLEKLIINRYPISTSEKRIIIYKPDVKSNALLLQKFLLEFEASTYFESLSKYIAPENSKIITIVKSPFAIGTLLQYKEEDVTYFYQIQGIKANVSSEKIPTQIPEKMKLADNNLHWWKPELESDKEKFNKWFALNKNLSNEKLEQQNETLNAMIENCIQIPLNTTTIYSKNKTTTWWKKPAAYAAAAIATLSAAYAYFNHKK